MSYLDIPRIHFAGKFFSNPSTVNNTPGNYDPAALSLDLEWNPNGTHYFLLQSCSVVSAVLDPSGALKTSSADDPVIGTTVEGGNDLASPKLVDLDPEWQGSSQIWGLKISISFGSEKLEGTLDTATLRDLWFGRVAGGGGIPAASGAFQSVLRNLRFTPVGPSQSAVFNKWKAAGLVAVRFVTYAYDPTSKVGAVVGTMGPAMAADPVQFLNARRLEPLSGPSPLGPRVYTGPLGPAPFVLDEVRKRLVIDLGNAIPETSVAGPRRAFGTMNARVKPASGPAVILGTLDYSQARYLTTAGVEELTLTDPQIAILKTRPLEVFVDGPPAKPVILAERPRGTNLEASETVLRLNPGGSETVDLFATRFGRPAATQVVSARLTTGGARTATGLTFTVVGGKTDAKGRVSIKFTASDPGKARLGGKLDGQIFFVEFDLGKTSSGSSPDWRGRIVVKVFDSFAAVASPKWADVRAIFEEYARLFPSMKAILDLSAQSKIQTASAAIKTTLTYPESDPRFMPVTRDLSRDKRDLILKWIAAGAP